ncbi:MAG: ABC transporter substrate-binding protein [Betaproteobacteria bacterium]|nr:ABC transporter substrate-binding protein [Betaproteobacteria bacterium]
MPLRIAIPDMISPSYFPAIAAVELGFFEREGLDAAIELIFPVARTFEELREGRIDFAGGAAHAPLYAFKDWRGCRLLCALAQKMYWFLVVRKDLDAKRGDLAAIRGLRIGAAPGPLDGLKRMLAEAHIDPEREVKIVPVPGSAGAGISFGIAAAKALEEGKLDGFWANGMGAEVAQRNGTGLLVVDARRGDGPPGAVDYTFPAFVATQAQIEREPERCGAAVRAIVSAQRALRAEPSLSTQACRRYFPAAETGLIAELIRRDAPFYDAAISAASAEALNAFSRSIGILSAPVACGQVVATQFRDLWKA